MKGKVLISDPMAEEGLAYLKQFCDVDYKPKLPADELLAIIGEYDALMVRSETKVTEAVIKAGTKLKVIGRAGVGVDNIDVPAATLSGIIVVNSPGGNTIAAAELSFALLLSLSRSVPQGCASLKNGEWQRSKFMGVELYNKTLGIIGLGKIGAEVAKRALAFGMNIIAFDPYATPQKAKELGVKLVSLDELYAQSNFITIHVPKNEQTKNLLDASAFAKMKKGVRIVNAARGGIIDEEALAEAVQSGQVAGAALDVFSAEPPPKDLKLLSLPQVVVTPHLGASTEEAQVQVALDVAEQIAEILNGGVARSPVNLPSVAVEAMQSALPYLKLGDCIGKFLAQIVAQPVLKVTVNFIGEWDKVQADMTFRASLAGIFSVQLAETVNIVNAPAIAQQRDIETVQIFSSPYQDYDRQLCITADYKSETHSVCGTVFGKNDIRITHIDNYRVEVAPTEIMLVTSHNDRPGMIGKVGTVMGSRSVNIAGMLVGREAPTGKAIMILQVDNPITPELLEEIRAIEGMETAAVVNLQ